MKQSAAVRLALATVFTLGPAAFARELSLGIGAGTVDPPKELKLSGRLELFGAVRYDTVSDIPQNKVYAGIRLKLS